MKKFFLLIFLINFSVAFSQGVDKKYWVQFTDKSNSPFSLNNPEVYLSKKSIDRRKRHNILINEKDLPVNPDYVDSIKSKGVRIHSKSKWLNGVIVETNDSLLAESLMSFSFVSEVFEIYRSSVKEGKGNKNTQSIGILNQVQNEAFSSCIPYFRNHPELDSRYGQNIDQFQNDEPDYSWLANYGHTFHQNNLIGVQLLHDAGKTGQGMMIAVLDAGFSGLDKVDAFQALLDENRVFKTYDFVRNIDNPYHSSSHGTYVMSVMAFNQPGDFVGTAPDATYLLLRSEDAATENIVEEFYWAVAAEYADSCGADIINTSLGYTTYDNPNMSYTYSDMDGNSTYITQSADIAASKGILVVTSAGNSGEGSWYYLGAPSDADSVLAVGAVDLYGNYAEFSSKGPSADNRVKPDIAAPGMQVFIKGSDIYRGNGTSYASPIIAGAAACLWQGDNYSFSNMEIYNAIVKSADRYFKPDDFTGYGIPNFGIAQMILKENYIDNLKSEKSFDIVPNPFKNHFYIAFKSDLLGTIDISIYDITGKLVFMEENVEAHYGNTFYSINGLEYLNRGIYIIKIETSGDTFNEMMVKSE